MRNLFLILLLFSAKILSGQTIRGTVFEKESGLPLPFAHVFVNNTTLGAASDEEGRFMLIGTFPDEIEIVASFVGYVTEVKTVSFENKNELKVDFELAFQESGLSEVELKAKRDKAWQREFRRFEEVFLAVPDDPYKSQIEIQNPWVVEFEKIKPKRGQNYLRASAREPLKIINRALGYRIDYYLQDYRLIRNGSRFYGQVFFEPLNPTDAEESQGWAEARAANYQGSIRSLNQSILLNAPDSVEFKLYRVLPERMDRRRTNEFYEELDESILAVSKDSLLRKPLENGNFRIFLPGKMEIHHLDKPWPNQYYRDVYHALSWIEAPLGFYDIDRRGVLINPTQLMLSGYLSRQRVARTLPLDFVPESGLLAQQPPNEILNDPSSKLNRLREKAWITTSKPYFYPGETAWLGGRMLYHEPTLKDSLSRVVYVDLLDSKAEVIQSATFPVREGKLSGALVLSEDLKPGDYALRAYTHWSRNFGQLDEFLTPFVVMELGYFPTIDLPDPVEYFGEIQVSSSYTLRDSLSYRLMDLELALKDGFDNPIDGEFILSITDAEYVREFPRINSLEQAMDWLDTALPEDVGTELSHPVEYGISIQGQFIPDKKRRPLINPITIVRGDLEDYGQVDTDSAGRFWATGLYFKDTAQIAVAAMDSKRKPYGSVRLDSLGKPDPPSEFPRIPYQKASLPTDEDILDAAGDYILLEEFVKEAKKEVAKESDWYGYGEPDRVMTEDQLAMSLNMMTVLTRMGFNSNSLKFGNYSYGERTGAPLLIIDGSKFPFLENQEFVDMINSYVPKEIKSVGIYTFGAGVFGMAGYSGVVILETKRGERIREERSRNFNSKGFQLFDVLGFTEFEEFPKNPPADQYLKKKPTIFWEPDAKTDDGVFSVQVKIPHGVRQLRIRIEGLTLDGEVFNKSIELTL
ncbi:carboxypeptidase-like regulatory domain-containing protein [Algoriphagus sp.]|uniref:carboxypeptidase-like regulatory domain-containing protein n=1 Tax=Algoriphagus sp. TaxID=1872435 RepID=UPI0026318A5A|nr:carboxypeptidase-like regulatory domain-containing protein [Algoriphagus sp.]